MQWERSDRLECDEHLYEEQCEVTWDKGSSGLVFHTDAARWDADKGDFDARTYDAMDVESGRDRPLCDRDRGTKRLERYNSGTAGQLLHVASAKRQSFAAGIEQQDKAGRERKSSSEQEVLLPSGATKRKHGAACRNRCEAFERDVRQGKAGRMLERMGWTDGDALGTKNGQKGVVGLAQQLVHTMLVRTEGCKKKAMTRFGLGYK